MSVDRTGTLQPGNYVICTSSTRPATPYTGQMIYQTDNKEFYIYDGGSWIPVAGDDDSLLTWTGL